MVNEAVIPMAAVGIQYYGGPVVTILASKTSRTYHIGCFNDILNPRQWAFNVGEMTLDLTSVSQKNGREMLIAGRLTYEFSRSIRAVQLLRHLAV